MKAERGKLQKRAWACRQRGWTQERIAADLGVNQATVSRWLRTIERRALAELTAIVRAEKVRQYGTLNHIVDEALEAWERSKKPLRRGRESIGSKSSGGSRTTDVTERDGDPLFLDAALAALRDLRALFGLDNNPAVGESGSMTVAAIAVRLKAATMAATKSEA